MYVRQFAASYWHVPTRENTIEDMQVIDSMRWLEARFKNKEIG